jgi:2-polyprenyl-3-methyl-5-hydroxy-6-metoxy-1,4-benzoquinol methylase
LKKLKCRFCGKNKLQIFLDLGKTPLANSYLDKTSLNQTEIFYPLCTYVCKNCFLVQLEEYETPKNIFTNYAYFSSYSDSWLKHAENYTEMMIARFKLNPDNRIVEIASNDGYLLQFFKEKNFNILGIEPASNIAKVAKKKGIPTITKFFDIVLAKSLVKKGRKADLIIGNNVLAHVPNLNDFVQGLKILLNSNGIITMEFPHLLQLIKHNQFDTIYHEHFSYFSFFVVQKIFASHRLTIFDVDEIPTHGGSLRIYATHTDNKNFIMSKNVNRLLKKEESFGLKKLKIYKNFSKNVINIKIQLCNFIKNVKNSNKNIVCYGAPAKGNTLLNYCGVASNDVDYTVDKSKFKQGLFLPGTHIPIKNPKILSTTKPDYVLILPWNLKDEIVRQLSYIRDWKGKFVIPIPKVRVFS